VDAHDLVRVVAMEPATLAWADALTNDDQLVRSIRWACDYAFGSIRGKLVHEGMAQCCRAPTGSFEGGG
jgi:hypothetical protein